jgi:hypothetical protein
MPFSGRWFDLLEPSFALLDGKPPLAEKFGEVNSGKVV